MPIKIAMIGAGSVGFTRKLMHDPLVGVICNPEEVWQMTNEMLAAQAKWLPQHADEIPLEESQ